MERSTRWISRCWRATLALRRCRLMRWGQVWEQSCPNRRASVCSSAPSAQVCGEGAEKQTVISIDEVLRPISCRIASSVHRSRIDPALRFASTCGYAPCMENPPTEKDFDDLCPPMRFVRKALRRSAFLRSAAVGIRGRGCASGGCAGMFPAPTLEFFGNLKQLSVGRSDALSAARFPTFPKSSHPIKIVSIRSRS